jgi:hypothetical protein
MSSATKTRKPRQVVRTITLKLNPFEGNPGVVRIKVVDGKRTTEHDYLLTPLASDFGTAFRLEKTGEPDGETYHVNLDGEKSSCECKGHMRHGRCKHVDGLTALVRAGKL